MINHVTGNVCQHPIPSAPASQGDFQLTTGENSLVRSRWVTGSKNKHQHCEIRHLFAKKR
ncbi:hypothetical protein BJQ48_04415 [Klebsiella pneumoniae]|nr:hypothetical protein [Klebsiella pneumoniae]